MMNVERLHCKYARRATSRNSLRCVLWGSGNSLEVSNNFGDFFIELRIRPQRVSNMFP